MKYFIKNSYTIRLGRPLKFDKPTYAYKLAQMEAFATITVFSQRKMSLHWLHRNKVKEIVLNSEYHKIDNG